MGRKIYCIIRIRIIQYIFLPMCLGQYILIFFLMLPSTKVLRLMYYHDRIRDIHLNKYIFKPKINISKFFTSLMRREYCFLGVHWLTREEFQGSLGVPLPLVGHSCRRWDPQLGGTSSDARSCLPGNFHNPPPRSAEPPCHRQQWQVCCTYCMDRTPLFLE